MDWDDTPDERVQAQWEKIISELNSLEGLEVPRCYFRLESKPVTVQLHAFSDASENAYAAAIYARSTYNNGHVEARLVTSKTRVSPVKKQTIPRLELLGALILARLGNAVVKAFPRVVEVFYWVDLLAVLCWIRNDRPWKRY